MTDLTIEELTIPASITDPDAADFIEMVRVRNEIEADVVGSRDLAYEPAELLPHYHDEFYPQTCLVARVGGRIVARAVYEAPIEEGSTDAWFTVEVLPAFRRRGIGSALFDRMVGMAEADGRGVLQAYILHTRSDDPETLPSPTGFGAVSLHNPETRFLLSRGFRLEQVERMSRLELPLDPDAFDRMLNEAEAKAGDYHLEHWAGPCPEKWVSGLGLLRHRMSTDAPSAGLDYVEEEWADERVRKHEALKLESPRVVLTTIAVHKESGEIAGFTELSVPPEASRPVQQNDTLVLEEHRGHRLGMLLKLANLRYLEHAHPGHPAVTTFNAEENRHMLSVNEAMGFVPVGYGGGWRRPADASAGSRAAAAVSAAP